ncbi:MAG: FKBP-type peptidyl-prolyl cis-trans isomerase [Oscillospiraceae bacterium]|nr:FKBP-type peptidyl-prolyl cis-trans isomerase [Oscillospiraceae bacterium]
MKMKKMLALTLAALTLLSLAACGGDSTTEDDTAEPGVNYSTGLDDNGYYADVRALDLVTLPEGYSAVTVPAGFQKAEEADIDAQIEELMAYFPENIKVTDRAVENGDTVNIDYVGSVDGVEFAGGNTNGMGTDVVAGSTAYIDDFLTQIIGAMPGDTVNVEVTFPDVYKNNPDLAGKDALFVTTINYIIEGSVVPELTDAFVAENLAAYYGCSTVEELRVMLGETIVQQQVTNYVLDNLFDNAVCKEVPKKIIDAQKALLEKEAQTAAEQEGIELSEWLSKQGYDSMDAYTSESEELLTSTAEQYLIIQAAAEDLYITVTDEDIEAYFTEFMGVADYAEYVAHYGRGFVAQAVLAEKTCDLLVARAQTA